MNKAKKKTVTLDSLAGMVQRGFLDVGKQFNSVYKKIDDLRAEVNDLRAEMNHRFSEIERRLEHLEKVIFDEQHDYILRLEDRLGKVEADFRALLGGKR